MEMLVKVQLLRIQCKKSNSIKRLNAFLLVIIFTKILFVLWLSIKYIAFLFFTCQNCIKNIGNIP